MPVIENTVRIERPPEDVFDSIGDPRSELEWNPKVRIMEKLTEGPIAPGTLFRAKWSKSPVIELEILRFDRPRGWAYRNGGAIAVDLDISLEPLDDGQATQLRSRFAATAHGPMRVIFPLMIASLHREEARNMHLIKKRIESAP
jgi:hypothetical protein